MFGTAIIVFREVLEAALVVSIVAAATRGLAGRGRLLIGGVVAGIVGAVLVAGFAGEISQWASGSGQALFNAGVLFAATALIAWHVLWMSRHGRELAGALNAVGRAVRDGSRPPSALMVVVALAILREGSEVVLFLYGLAAGGTTAFGLAAGSATGLAAGVAAGLALYLGLLRIPPGRMFSATNWILLLIAAGMASQAGQFLVQANWLPSLGGQLWDTSRLISDGSPLGHLLHVLIGYDARPDGVQLVLFIATLVIVGVLGRWLRSAASRPPASGTSVA